MHYPNCDDRGVARRAFACVRFLHRCTDGARPALNTSAESSLCGCVNPHVGSALLACADYRPDLSTHARLRFRHRVVSNTLHRSAI